MSENDFSILSHKGPYQVSFGGAMPDAGPGVHLIVDARVARLHADRLAAALSGPSVLAVEATEDAKDLARFPIYVDHLVRNGVRRDHVLVAVGGGVIQDITCFLAATMLRGLPWRFWPTTLLAQADSCIGSKSSINAAGAKNILGTFTPPERVTIDVAFLATLDERDVRSGIGEMLKVHAIAGPGAFDAIAAEYPRLFSDPAVMRTCIRRSLEIKKDYIERDEFDRGQRNIFNYGHSFGHALEAATHFAIPHGIAVTIGMDMANFCAARLGVGAEADFRRMHEVLAANYRGFEAVPVPLDDFLAALAKDKKNVGASATLILPDRDGRMGKHVQALDGEFRALCAEFFDRARAGELA